MPNNSFFVNLILPADISGCAHYRLFFPYWTIRNITKNNVRFIESMKLITDPNFFRDIRTVKLQRQVNDIQCQYFLQFLVPLAKSLGFWIIYEVDDVIAYEDIPPYNHGRKAYQNEQFFNNVQQMLAAADFLTVTTEKLKDYYINKFKIEANKVVVIPNYVPRWWVGETYDLERIKQRFENNKKKPRIGFPLSSSHYDITGINNHVDDLTHICDFIRDTCDKYDYVFTGHVPKQLEGVAVNKKITVVPGSDVLNYPRELWQRGLDLIIAPLQDNTFNRCKSPIKLIESWGLGIPAIVQHLDPYTKYTDMTFKDANDLQNQIDKLLKDKKRYIKIVKSNRRVVDYGDKNAPNGWWLEKNLKTHYDLSTLPQKTVEIDLETYGKAQQQPEPKPDSSDINLVL